MHASSLEDSQAIVGSLLGTAAADALGLPYEKLSKQRIARWFGSVDRHRFLLGRGMISDDTEHSCLTLQAIIVCGIGDPEAFQADLGRRIKWWFAGLPAGLGRATLRSCLKMWLGIPPPASSVRSHGNGVAMRTAVLGVLLDDLEAIAAHVQASAAISHRSQKAEFGALAIALAAWQSKQGRADAGILMQQLEQLRGGTAEMDELLNSLAVVQESVQRGESTAQYAEHQGHQRGVSGYVYATVPVALHAWLTHPDDYAAAVVSCIECGGDTDTTAAIVGAVVGARVGEDGIPREWISGLCEWPCGVAWMRSLAAKAQASVESREDATRPPTLFFPFVLARNLFFLLLVLAWAVRRMFPPY